MKKLRSADSRTGRNNLKRPSKFSIAMAAIVLLVAVCIGILVLFRSGVLQRDAQAHGATVLQGAGLDGGTLQNVSALDEGFGPLEGTGPLQGGGPLLGAFARRLRFISCNPAGLVGIEGRHRLHALG